MTDKIEWGAEIPVNGVRPDWLGDDEALGIIWNDGKRWEHLHTLVEHVSGWENAISAIILPANHEYYRRKETASEPVAPPGYVLVKQMTREEWYRTVGADPVFWAKRVGLIRPETHLEQFERESGIAITDANKDAVVAALEWGKDHG